MNTFELVTAVIGGISVWLSVRQSVWSWPTAIANVLLSAVVYYQTRLYADMGLQVVYAVLSVYGWYEWLYGGKGRTVLRVTRTPLRLWPLLGVIAAGGSVGLGILLHRTTNAASPFLDSCLASTSLVAQWMMTKKLLENWLVWIVVDLVYVPLLFYKSLYWFAALYTVFLVLAALGDRDWRRSTVALDTTAPVSM